MLTKNICQRVTMKDNNRQNPDRAVGILHANDMIQLGTSQEKFQMDVGVFYRNEQENALSAN